MDKEGNAYFDFSPATNIADAWQVVKKLANSGDVLVAKDFNDDQWEVEITIWKNKSIYKHVVEKEETAPLAICLSALRATDVEVEETK